MTLSITSLSMEFSYAECRIFIIMLSVIMLGVVMLSVLAPKKYPKIAKLPILPIPTNL